MAQVINVDMTPGYTMPFLHFSQGDIGREFKVNIVSRDGSSVPVGATISMKATKPSGFGFDVDADSFADGVATFTTIETMTNEAGIFLAEIVIEYNGDVIGTSNFYMKGEVNPHPDWTVDGDAETFIPELTILVERIEAAAETVEAVEEIVIPLNSRMTAIETEQAVQDARMDSFVTLAEGSTTGDAELQDIRVGANGATYPNAGDAVRGQVTDLKSDITAVNDTKIYFDSEGYICFKEVDNE